MVHRSALRMSEDQLVVHSRRSTTKVGWLRPMAVVWRTCEDFTTWPVVVDEVYDPVDGVTYAKVRYIGLSHDPIVTRTSRLHKFTPEFARQSAIHAYYKENEKPIYTHAVQQALVLFARFRCIQLTSVYRKLKVPDMWRLTQSC